MNNLSINKEKKFISWEHNGEVIVVNEVIVESAIINKSLEIVLAIDQKLNNNHKLVAFSSKGHKILEESSPKGFSFSYVTHHPSIGPAVVCYEERNNGWEDFYFSIDIQTGKLEKYGKSY